MKAFRLTWRRAVALALVLAINLLAPPVAHAQDCNGGTECADYNELMQYLQGSGRRDPEYRILQARHGQPTLAPRHRQYGAACYFFGIAPILEYLGYTQFVRRAHFVYDMPYAASNGVHWHDWDAGYHLSAEHLIALNIHNETFQNLCQDNNGWYCNPLIRDEFYSNVLKTTIKTSTGSCRDRFAAGQEYGMCSTLANTYQEWLDAAGSGCDDGGRCPCAPDASCGMYWFANEVLNPFAGCNDMRGFTPSPSSTTDKTHMRRVIKAFIDHNLPLLVAVREGEHFMVLIGYLELDGGGLPRKGILIDSYGLYRIVSLTTNWAEHDNNSLRSLFPWNHHFGEACESGGWAAQLDGRSSKYKLCSMPSGRTELCNLDRIYGARVVCQDNGLPRATYFAHDGDLFISDEDNVSCDNVLLQYSDAQRTVQSATIQRFWYSPARGRWISGPVWQPNVLETPSPGTDRPGPLNVIEWNGAWPTDYWLIADGLSGTYTKRRTTIALSFDDGTTERIELSPPDTYGIAVDCIDNGVVIETYRSEADHSVFRATGAGFEDKQFLYDQSDRSCDAITVRVNLGYGENVVSARLQRYLYTPANHAWVPAQSAFSPDRGAIVSDGLSGYTRVLEWDGAWPENYWLVGDDVGSGSSWGDRKTVLRLYDGSMNLLREAEIVPY